MFNNLMQAIPSFIQAYPAIKTGLEGKNLKNQQRTLDQLQGVTQAQYNPDSAVYQKLYGQNKDMLQGDLASTIAEVSRQNRKLVSMGRSPLLDQERGGESVFRNLIMGQQDAGDRARTNTVSQLSGAGSALRGLYGQQDLLADEGYNNKVRKVGAYYSIGDALKGLFNLDG